MLLLVASYSSPRPGQTRRIQYEESPPQPTRRVRPVVGQARLVKPWVVSLNRCKRDSGLQSGAGLRCPRLWLRLSEDRAPSHLGKEFLLEGM